MIGRCRNCRRVDGVDITGMCPRCDEIMIRAVFNAVKPMTYFGMVMKGELELEAL